MESRMRKANKLNLMKSVETCLQDCNGSDCLRCVVQTDASTLSSECKMTNSLYAWLLFGLFNLCAHHKTAVRLLNGFNTFCHCYRILRWISFTPQMDCKKTTYTHKTKYKPNWIFLICSDNLNCIDVCCGITVCCRYDETITFIILSVR